MRLNNINPLDLYFAFKNKGCSTLEKLKENFNCSQTAIDARMRELKQIDEVAYNEIKETFNLNQVVINEEYRERLNIKAFKKIEENAEKIYNAYIKNKQKGNGITFKEARQSLDKRVNREEVDEALDYLEKIKHESSESILETIEKEEKERGETKKEIAAKKEEKAIERYNASLTKKQNKNELGKEKQEEPKDSKDYLAKQKQKLWAKLKKEEGEIKPE
jgi:hypothetical protein